MSAIPERLVRASTQEAWAARAERRQAIMEERVRRAVVAWLDGAKRDVSDARLRAAIVGDAPERAVADIVADAMAANEDIDLGAVANDAGQHLLRDAARQLGVPVDRIDPASVAVRSARWAEEYRPVLAGEVTDETRRAVASRVADGFRQGQSTATVANRISEVIGLTERDADTAQRIREQALADGRTERQADRLAERYADQRRAARAQVIAQTESQRAASAGRAALWKEFVEVGAVDADTVVRIWVTMEDERVCDICGPLHEKEAKMGEPFPGGYDDPPAHPQCRCKAYFEARSTEQ